MKGKIKVDTKQILPVIKKWLYSEKEIFFREMISNSYDAITKLRKISLSEEIRDGMDGELKIEVTIDRAGKKLIISDNGIGMTREEIEMYLAQIASSGASDFIRQYEETKDKDQSGIIGNFGLGFYSVFMIADLVEVESLSYRKDAQPVCWRCDGNEDYEIEEGKINSRGTQVTLHIKNEENKEYLEKIRIDSLVRKYVDFIPVAITVDGAQANRKDPLWMQSPSKVKAEQYTEFYKYLYPHQKDPLFSIHLNVDYPFVLQGILYFPHLEHEMDLNRSNVKIYCKQIFVSDQAQEIIPQYLTVLQGMIDIPNLPLNVSRSYLQNEPQIKKISSHVVKKVTDKLKEEFAKDRQQFHRIWQQIAPFVKYAVLNDEKFYDQVSECILFEIAQENDADKEFVTLKEYQDKNKGLTETKVYYTISMQTHVEQIQMLRTTGIQVVLLDTLIDNHFIQYMEFKNADVKFVRIDAEISDHILEKIPDKKILEVDAAKPDEGKGKLENLFRSAVENEKLLIRLEKFKDNHHAAMILLPEQMRRLQEMTTLMAGKGADQQQNKLKDMEHTLVLNATHPLVKYLLESHIVHASVDLRRADIARQVYLLARLSQGFLSASEMQDFIQSGYKVLGHLVSPQLSQVKQPPQSKQSKISTQKPQVGN